MIDFQRAGAVVFDYGNNLRGEAEQLASCYRRVLEVAADIGAKLKALKPDLWIIFSNDHAEQFFHNVAPPFTIHVGGEATGDFACRKLHWKVPSEIGFELVRELYRQNFDPDRKSVV